MISGCKNPQTGAMQGRSRLRLAIIRNILGDAIRNYQTNGDTNQAAAIALYALLSIVPLFILTLLTIDNLFSSDPDIQQKLIEGIRPFIPTFSGELLTQFWQVEKKKELLGGVGIISLIWFSSMIFGAIETALNIIFRSKSYRSYITSKLLAIGMIPLGWGIGIVSVGITYTATILEKQPLLGQGSLFFFPLLHVALFRYLLPYLLTVLFFTFVYKAIPTEKVSLKSALIGSAIFSILMEIAKQFFTWYVANYTRYNLIFGSLEAVVILVIWVFYIALILLFCAELISSYLRRDMIIMEKAFPAPEKGRLRIDERLLRKFSRFYNQDEYAYREGDVGENLFYILSGRVQIERSAGKTRKIFHELGPGDFFGEMAALIQEPHTSSARCIEFSHIAVVNGITLRRLLRESDDVSIFMLKEFSTRIRTANAEMQELTHSWIRMKVILYFLLSWPLPEGQNPVEGLTKSTGKSVLEIQDALIELDHRGVITWMAGDVTGFNREAALRFVE
jgi:membrane protein